MAGDSWVIPSWSSRLPSRACPGGRRWILLSDSKEGRVLPPSTAWQGMGRAWAKVVDGMAGFRGNDITLYTLMQFLLRLKLGDSHSFLKYKNLLNMLYAVRCPPHQ